MKKSILFTFVLTLLFAVSASAQDNEFSSTRLDNYANQLKRSTVDLSDRTYDELRRRNSSGRRVVEDAFLAQQLDASAGLFQQMVRDNLRAAELREAVSLMSELLRRAPTYGSNINLWRDARNSIDDINRELGGRGSGGNGGNDGNPGGNRSGKAFWRGTVDNKVQLFIKDNIIETRTIEGRPYPDGTYSFTTSLPNRNVEIFVDKKSGRGSVRVLQQPNRSNDYAAVIEIYDDGGGAKEYRLEISW